MKRRTELARKRQEKTARQGRFSGQSKYELKSRSEAREQESAKPALLSVLKSSSGLEEGDEIQTSAYKGAGILKSSFINLPEPPKDSDKFYCRMRAKFKNGRWHVMRQFGTENTLEEQAWKSQNIGIRETINEETLVKIFSCWAFEARQASKRAAKHFIRPALILELV